ncbi:MAG: pyridoxal-phosphate dependent enzyme [Psychromonas sp.]
MNPSYVELNENLQKIIKASPLQKVTHPLLDEYGLKLSVKRDDLLHPDISGNKWRKLKFNLLAARSQEVNHIISFGGAFSNHIHALAAAGFHLGFKTTGIIRGESSYASNPTLNQAQAWGMELEFVSRIEYRRRNDSDYLLSLKERFPNALIVPEGGSNQTALPGVMESVQEMQQQSTCAIDHIITATGSGGTLAGLIAGSSKTGLNCKVTGVAVLKKADYLNQQIEILLQQNNVTNAPEWRLQTRFHQGGYAKVNKELALFCQQFSLQTGIPIEPIYTGKMFYALFELVEQGHFKKGEHIIALHTGGLQGINGLQTRNLF